MLLIRNTFLKYFKKFSDFYLEKNLAFSYWHVKVRDTFTVLYMGDKVSFILVFFVPFSILSFQSKISSPQTSLLITHPLLFSSNACPPRSILKAFSVTIPLIYSQEINFWKILNTHLSIHPVNKETRHP